MGRYLCVWLLCWSSLLSAQSTDAPDPAVTPQAQRMDELQAQFAQLELEVRNPPEAEGERQAALLFRRDQRALELLAAFVDVARKVLTLPVDSGERGDLAARLALSNSSMDQVFSQRLHKLEQRIDAELKRLESLGGIDRINAEAQIETFNNQRLAYLEQMIDIVEIRRQLNFPPGDFETISANSLQAYGNELTGVVELRVAARDAIASQLAKASDNADLKSAAALQQHAIERAAAQLDRVVNQLERLGIDTSRQRRVLMKQSTALTVSLVDSDVMGIWLKEATEAFDSWLRTDAVDVSAQVLLFLLILLAARLLARFARTVVQRMLLGNQGNMSNLLRDVLVSLTGGLVLTLGVLFALNQVGISVAPMLAGLGVAGFILGFALQDVLGNFAAGAMILAYRPFDVDDYIRVAEVEGFVKKMNLVSTTITTIDNQTLIVPNSKIWGDVIRNYTGQRVRRVDLEFGISYGDSIEKAERILHDVVESMPAILKSPEPIIRVHRLGDSSVDFVVRPWVRTEDYWETHWGLIKAVKLRFDAEGITIPFPQRDVHHHYPAGQTLS